MMQPPSIRRIFIIAGITSLFISYLGIWMRLINNPVERTGSDFIHFYSAGRIAQNKGAAHVYDLALQHEMEEEQVGFPLAEEQVLPYNHLPFLIPILQVTVSADYVSSFYRWVLIMLIIYVSSITVLGSTLKQTGMDRGSILIVAAGALLFLPVFFSLMNGQDTAILLLGTSIWMYGLISGREWTAGFGLSLTTVRPHIALILALPMLFRYRKIFLGFLLGSGALALFSFSILGLEGTREFINILFISAGGEWYGIKQYAMFNLIGLLMRMVPWLEAATIRTFGWIIYGITILSLVFLWARSRHLRDSLIGLTVTLALFVVPHLHFHDLTLLLIPIYAFIRSSTQSTIITRSVVTVLPIVISLLLLISNASPYLQYTIPYLNMLALAGYPYYLEHKMTLILPHQS